MFSLCIFHLSIIRGRHASKKTEEEEDEECLKEEEDGLSGTGTTRLLTQPSCEIFFILIFLSFISLGFLVFKASTMDFLLMTHFAD